MYVTFSSTIGIPCAVIVAIIIVVLLVTSAKRDFKVKGLGGEFWEPSAPLTMWVICFWSLVFSMYFLSPKIEKILDLMP